MMMTIFCLNFWGTSSPRSPTRTLPLRPTGGLSNTAPFRKSLIHLYEHSQVEYPAAYVERRYQENDPIQ